jgi:hypothetical protein
MLRLVGSKAQDARCTDTSARLAGTAVMARTQCGVGLCAPRSTSQPEPWRMRYLLAQAGDALTDTRKDEQERGITVDW